MEKRRVPSKIKSEKSFKGACSCIQYCRKKSQRARLKIKKEKRQKKRQKSSLYHRHAVRVEIDEDKMHEASIKEDWEVLEPESMIEHLDDDKPED